MAFNALLTAQNAASLIDSFGSSVTLRSKTDGAGFSPITGPSGSLTTDMSGKAVIDSFATNLIDGAVIRDTDVRVFLSPVTFSAKPKQGDQIILGARELEVVRLLNEIQAQDQSILYEVQARGS